MTPKKKARKAILVKAPSVSPNEAFTELDRYLLDELIPNNSPEPAAAFVANYAMKPARLGGYWARGHDRPPGNTVIWR